MENKWIYENKFDDDSTMVLVPVGKNIEMPKSDRQDIISEAKDQIALKIFKVYRLVEE